MKAASAPPFKLPARDFQLHMYAVCREKYCDVKVYLFSSSKIRVEKEEKKYRVTLAFKSWLKKKGEQILTLMPYLFIQQFIQTKYLTHSTLPCLSHVKGNQPVVLSAVHQSGTQFFTTHSNEFQISPLRKKEKKKLL